MTPPTDDPTLGLLLIAHGSRRDEANADLHDMAARLTARGYPLVQASFLELAEPDIVAGGRLLVARGARTVVLSPYFLSPGRHMRTDLAGARAALAAEFPQCGFRLAECLGPHPSLDDLQLLRAAECLPTAR